jgi:hypothetical protein
VRAFSRLRNANIVGFCYSFHCYMFRPYDHLETDIYLLELTSNSDNACYHSVQNLLSSRLLSKNLKIRIYKTMILSVILYGCETWSLTLRKGTLTEGV